MAISVKLTTFASFLIICLMKNRIILCSLILCITLFLTIFSCQKKNESVTFLSEKEIDNYWREGKTLPLGVSEKYPLPIQQITNDNGMNILIDMAHQTQFVTLWSLNKTINELGFRSIGNQASLQSVLDPDGKSRVRVPFKDGIFPFAWIPNLNYNIIITEQESPRYQEYLPEEIEALKKFVRNGGGLLIQCGPDFSLSTDVKNLSLEKLIQTFDANLANETDLINQNKYATFVTDDKWETLRRGEYGKIIEARRVFGKGRVMLIGAMNTLMPATTDSPEIQAKNKTLFTERLKWLAEGKEPVGGEPRVPSSMAGGGGIYPELEKNIGDVVLFYALNQRKELLDCMDNDLPRAQRILQDWFPSKKSEPIYLVLAAGSGGAWVVNAYKPKEVGLISINPLSLIDAYAFEMGHLNSGPANGYGRTAGWVQAINGSNGQAGWFQGKILAVFNDSYKNKPNRDCNSFFKTDKKGDSIDLAQFNPDELYSYNDKITKLWYVFQKLDDRYGTTWYPRWLWVMNTRWDSTPEKQLTFDEMAEDMSIAVGEDLFPFFAKLGTTLGKNRLSEIEFNNETIRLKVAPLEVTPAGTIRLDSIKDYMQPIIVSE